jgi:hypothetical protein
MDYDPPVKPSAGHIYDETLVDHFVAPARKDNIGRIAMMWLDYAAMKREWRPGTHSPEADHFKEYAPGALTRAKAFMSLGESCTIR